MDQTQLNDRALIRLSPQSAEENPREFLQGLVTNDVLGALPVWAGLLSAQGKTMFDFLVWADGTDILLDCETDQADALAKRLSLYRLRRKISIARDNGLAVHWQENLREGAVPDPRLAALGWRWLAPARPSDSGADARWRKHRLTHAVPEGQAELGDILWLETNAADLNGVSFTKGCYIGQENTARMNWRQKINRRLVVVPLEQSHEKRRKFAHPELGLAIDHLRVEDIAPAMQPDWMTLGQTQSE